MQRARTSVRKLASDQRGMALVEMAALAPFLALLTVGIVDLTNAITERMKLYHAVHRTLERVSSRDIELAATENQYNFEYLKPIAAQAAGVQPSAVQVTVWLECNGVEQTVYASTCPDISVNGVMTPQVSARYLQLHIDSSYKPMFAIGPLGGRPGQNYTLFAEGAVRIQ